MIGLSGTDSEKSLLTLIFSPADGILMCWYIPVVPCGTARVRNYAAAAALFWPVDRLHHAGLETMRMNEGTLPPSTTDTAGARRHCAGARGGGLRRILAGAGLAAMLAAPVAAPG